MQMWTSGRRNNRVVWGQLVRNITPHTEVGKDSVKEEVESQCLYIDVSDT